jgi:methionyl-tRNA formyltransferase
MKIVFLFNEYSLHNHIITSTIQALPGHQFVIIKVPMVLKGSNRMESGRKILPQLSARFIFEKIYEFLLLTYITWCPKILPFGAAFRRLRWIAKRHNVKFFRTHSITQPATLDFLRHEQPDVIITLMHQIVKGELLGIAKKGIINIHPGLLPQFRGIQPYFWALSEGAQMTGASLHFIEDEGVDTGALLAQIAFPIPEKTSVSLLYYLTARAAGELLPSMLKLLDENNVDVKPQMATEGHYYRFPDQAAFNRLWARGHSLIRAKDIFAIILGRYDHFKAEQIHLQIKK